MRLRVNGEPHELPEGTTVRALLVHLDLADAVVAVAVNETFVARADHARHVLRGGDRVDVVAPMAGG